MIITKELSAVWKKHFNGLSLRQIAKETGLSASTISSVQKNNFCDPATHDKINNWILSKKAKQSKLIKKLKAA